MKSAIGVYSIDFAPLIELCRQNDIVKLSVFGSVARGEADEDSDVDLLVELSKPKGLFAFVALEQKMSEILGKKVDLCTESGLSPYIRDQVKQDLQLIYERAK